MSVLGNKVFKQMDRILDRNSKSYREKLNKNIHVLDISYRAMLNSIPSDYSEASFVQDYNHFITILRAGLKNSRKLSVTVRFINKNANTGTYYVDDPEYGVFVVGASFGAVQSKVRQLLSVEKNTSFFTRFNDQGVTLNNLGHAPTRNLGGVGQSPLKLKLLDLLRLAPENPAIIAALDRLHNTHESSTSYSVERPDIDVRKLQRAIGSASVLVTIQSAEKNNELAAIEAAIERDLRNFLNTQEFRDSFLVEKGSNSILQDIEESLKQIISGKKVKLPKHNKKNPEVQKKKLDVTTKPKVSGARPPRLKNLAGERTSLASLKNILDQRLAEQIRSNMGKGNARAVLNNRTGRFSESASISRLTRDKDGSIKAFYTYMKYPYQTFEPGFNQGSPASRNPQLLISKSIRQIAASIVAARLKAIPV
jgi:hypothetical protein